MDHEVKIATIRSAARTYVFGSFVEVMTEDVRTHLLSPAEAESLAQALIIQAHLTRQREEQPKTLPLPLSEPFRLAADNSGEWQPSGNAAQG